jgi:cell division protein FtsL
MDPITLGISAVGLGMKLYGGFSAADDQKAIAESEKKIAGLEQNVNAQKQQAMELSARRQQMEIFRNTQRARAQGLQAAVSQGAQYGSGMPGGQAATLNQGLFNALGVTQNLEFGRNIFGIDSQISSEKMKISDEKSQLAEDQGWSNLGSSLMGSAGTFGNVAGAAKGGFQSLNLGSMFMGGGSPSGY